MEDISYYDGTKLLSLRDLNKNLPEIYIVDGNRSSGKTTYFMKMLLNHSIKQSRKFALLFRFQNELDDCYKNFNIVCEKWFKNYEIQGYPKDKGSYYVIECKHKHTENIKVIGFAISLNAVDKIKKKSHYFSEVQEIFFDEFQPESGRYLPHEIKNFQSIHTSIARGFNQMYRRVPVYMCSNAITLLNPYYTALNISSRIQHNTKFLRGNGWVAEFNLNKDAQNAQLNSAFNQAFESNYLESAASNIYLNDNKTFITQLPGKLLYMLTFKYNNKCYSLKTDVSKGFVFVTKSVDMSFPVKLAVSASDMSEQFLHKASQGITLTLLRKKFDTGCFRFQDLECKEAAFQLLGIIA
ncbi:MAG: DNA encapsidation protein [Podoviridae sp. ctjc_2]|nr:MAG: DNA encapsidation protein [Podoviridae sp. ctjc_2]